MGAPIGRSVPHYFFIIWWMHTRTVVYAISLIRMVVVEIVGIL
jgi:hypothetical protein